MTESTRGNSPDNHDAACVVEPMGVESGYRGKEARQRANAPGRDTEGGTSMPDKTNARGPREREWWEVRRQGSHTLPGVSIGKMLYQGRSLGECITWIECQS